MQAHTVTPQRLADDAAALQFICNASAASAERFLFDRCTIGRPRAMNGLSVEQLERQDIVGIYEREAPSR